MVRGPYTGAELAAMDIEENKHSLTGCRALLIYFIVAVLLMLGFIGWMIWKVLTARTH